MKEDNDARGAPMFNQSIEKGLGILAAFGPNGRSMSIGQIAEAVGITRSSAQRVVFTLEALGYLLKDPFTRRYELANKVMEIGCNYLETNPLIDSANPILSAANSACDETVSLTEPSGLQMVYLATFTSRKPIVAHMTIGSRMPIYCTAAGRAYLSGLEDDEVMKILQSEDRKRYTVHTRIEIDEILPIIQESRARGFATNFEEYYLGHMNVGAPVFNANGRAVAAVNLIAPTSRWSTEELTSKLGPMVLDCARAITNATRGRR
jgi:IclR family pca regulon transcriptional regulator